MSYDSPEAVSPHIRYPPPRVVDDRQHTICGQQQAVFCPQRLPVLLLLTIFSPAPAARRLTFSTARKLLFAMVPVSAHMRLMVEVVVEGKAGGPKVTGEALPEPGREFEYNVSR